MLCVQNWNENLATNAREQKSLYDSGLGVDHAVAETQGSQQPVADMLPCFLPLFFSEVLTPATYVRLGLLNSSRCSWANCSIYPSQAASLPLCWKLQPPSNSCPARCGNANSHQLQFMLRWGTIVNAS